MEKAQAVSNLNMREIEAVDGYEVKAENNQYTFKAVNANHTISVTFEQARKIDSPKTGDSVNVTVVLAVLIISALLLAGIFV